jgi:hypothetical protein
LPRRNWSKVGPALISIGLASVFVIWAAYINTARGDGRYLPLMVSVALMLAGIAIWVGRDKGSEPRAAHEFSDVNASYIMKIYKEHSEIQAQKLVQPYIGKWLRVTGPLGNVGEWHDYQGGSFVYLQQRPDAEPVLMRFSDRKVVEGRLAGLPIGADITAIGRIDSVVLGNDIMLEDCELESVRVTDVAGVRSLTPEGPDFPSEAGMPVSEKEPAKITREISEAFARDDYASLYPDGRYLYYEGNDFEGYGRILRSLGLEWDNEVGDAFECPADRLNIIYVLADLDSQRFGWGT